MEELEDGSEEFEGAAEEPITVGPSRLPEGSAMTPLEFLEDVYTNEELPVNTRIRAAIGAAKYRHASYQAVAVADLTGDLGQRLKEAIERAKKAKDYVDSGHVQRRQLRPPGQVIEADYEDVSSREMAKPFVSRRT